MNSWRHRFARFSGGIARALLVGSLGLSALAVQAEDDPPGRVGRLAEMKGQVWLLEAGQGEWQTAERNRPVTTADRLATDADSRAELQIGSTTIRLDQGSDLEVTRLDDERIELTLHGGAASLRVREAEVAREVMILTPEGRFQPRSPGLFRIDRSDRGSLANATRGELDFESSDSQLALRAGQRAEFWFDEGDRRTHYNWVGMPNDEFETWVRADDSRDERYTTRRPISPEMTGADDLEGNGQWDTHPEYGSIWTPTTVAVGWAPYRYGRWAWVRPWGWTWVDDAPWGFAPFHYGRWVNWRGRWCWAPGTYVRRPVYAPAMVAWVGGPHLSVGISIGRPVGWVPLAPREVYYPQYRVSPVYIKQVNVTHIHVHEHNRRPAPNRPIMYANGKVAGGVTVVSSDVLTRRQAIGSAQRPSDTSVMAAMRSPRAAVAVEPPKPDNASFAPRTVRRPDAPVAPPPRSVARVDRGDRGDDRGPRSAQDRGAQVQGGQPGRPGEPAVARPQVGASPRDGRGDQARDQAAGDRARDRREPARDGAAERPAVQRPPITQRDNPRDATPGFQQRDRDNVPGFQQPRREPREQPVVPRQQPQQQLQQPQQQPPQREPREHREVREREQPQAAPREERQQRQAERQERAERQQERQREPKSNKNDRESRQTVN
jgi:hypothetical protein